MLQLVTVSQSIRNDIIAKELLCNFRRNCGKSCVVVVGFMFTASEGQVHRNC